MTIAYPLTMPAAPGFAGSRFGIDHNVTLFLSPLSRVQQAIDRDGARWFLEVRLPPMLRAGAGAWIGFLNGLRGGYGTFKGFDPDARTPRGAGTGTPRVDGAGQTGNTLATDGWSANVTGILLAGDYLAIASPSQRLHQVVADADSNGAGQATLSIVPRLRESPSDNATLTVANPFGLFRLAANEVAWDADNLGVFGLGFTAIEAL